MKEGWSKVTLQEVCLPVDKVKRKNKSPDDKLIYLDIGGIDNEKNRIVDYKTYTWESAPSRAQQIIDLNDVLFSTVRTYLRNIAQVQNPLFIGQIASSGFTVLRANPEALDHRFLFLYTLSEKFLSPLHKLQSGSSYPAVRDKDVLSQLILLPPIQELTSHCGQSWTVCFQSSTRVEELKSAQEKLNDYRQSVLKKAFEGELTKEWRAKQTDLPTGEDLLENLKEEKGRFHSQKLEEWEIAVRRGTLKESPGKNRLSLDCHQKSTRLRVMR